MLRVSAGPNLLEHVPPDRPELQQVELAPAGNAALPIEPGAPVATDKEHVERDGDEEQEEDRRKQEEENARDDPVHETLGKRVRNVFLVVHAPTLGGSIRSRSYRDSAVLIGATLLL